SSLGGPLRFHELKFLPDQSILKQLAICQFTTDYWNYETDARVDYKSDSEDEDILDSGLCIFHDENYLQDENNSQKIVNKLMLKVSNSISQKEGLLCIGYHLPDVTIRNVNFAKPVYFSKCKFLGELDLYRANFAGLADFYETTFSGP